MAATFGPFETKKRAEEELAAELARVGGGAPVTDRSLLVRDYLDTWLAGKKLRLVSTTCCAWGSPARVWAPTRFCIGL